MTAHSRRFFTLSELAEHTGGTVSGDGSVKVSGVGTLAGAKGHEISFLTNIKYKSQLETTSAGAVILNEKTAPASPVPALIHDNPHAAFARVAQLFDNTPPVAEGIADSAVVAASASIGADVSIGHNVIIEDNVVLGDNVSIGANSVIGKGTRIGQGSTIYPNVTIYHDIAVGKRVTIHSQTVIGAAGFGYANDKGTWLPIPQTGSVIIGDDTQIGASSTVDRGAIEDTVIGKNVIIDNQVQVGHNCIIGDHSCICGATGIAGSCSIGKYVIIGGGCGINGHISICDNVQVTGYTMIVQDITESGLYSSGQPAMKNRDWRKVTIRTKQIDDLFNRVKLLEKQQ
ncbi:UDP-3-O-(3-hydroxymyristoyl)glucosamine N-acyltransferase [Aestuariibacter sp. A3R04]|uniref:UDP-3-O-(3-hydroxymyristoyl)glucosamine N-acyltransferase n=1 Tax=Aestuariibacter sp. A3R04 TaxID=2841571 RepID=UPI001C0972D8|nr:UDP-3-O-(3-hydroxymyristoyl)glucosamine N-acyltransferase [Aestuariibacter sp. A3R04]MBU3021891.1 UDP-3-O-(3-hydroxymyristoyl)glucosamine N-acyltransferase [Aestuariibacter sp. A3R04]